MTSVALDDVPGREVVGARLRFCLGLFGQDSARLLGCRTSRSGYLRWRRRRCSHGLGGHPRLLGLLLDPNKTTLHLGDFVRLLQPHLRHGALRGKLVREWRPVLVRDGVEQRIGRVLLRLGGELLASRVEIVTVHPHGRRLAACSQRAQLLSIHILQVMVQDAVGFAVQVFDDGEIVALRLSRRSRRCRALRSRVRSRGAIGYSCGACVLRACDSLSVWCSACDCWRCSFLRRFRASLLGLVGLRAIGHSLGGGWCRGHYRGLKLSHGVFDAFALHHERHVPAAVFGRAPVHFVQLRLQLGSRAALDAPLHQVGARQRACQSGFFLGAQCLFRSRLFLFLRRRTSLLHQLGGLRQRRGLLHLVRHAGIDRQRGASGQRAVGRVEAHGHGARRFNLGGCLNIDLSATPRRCAGRAKPTGRRRGTCWRCWTAGRRRFRQACTCCASACT